MYYESDTVELKRTYTKDVIKEIIAFLNTRGGDIFIGVKDDGSVVGVEDIDATISQLSNAIHDNIQPDAKIFIRLHLVEDNVICVSVHEGNHKPYYLKGKGLRPEGVYVRLGRSSVPSSEMAIKQMIIASMNTNYEDLVSVDQNLTFDAANEFFSVNKLPISESDYRRLGIYDDQNRFTNLARIISDQSKHSVKVAVFLGDDDFRFQDRKDFTGSVFQIMKDVLHYIDFSNHLNAHVVKYQREEQYSYNTEVLREGLINALIHRDYAYSGAIHVSIYRNRIEIVSLGGLVFGLSMEEIELGVSQCRNPNLAQLFYRVKFIEAYGTGMKKILRDYPELSLSQIIHASTNGFKLILWNHNIINPIFHDAVKYDVTKEENLPYKTLTKEEKEVLTYVEKKKIVSRGEIEELLSIGQTKAGLLLKGLVDKGHLNRSGKGKNIRYY